MSKVHVAAIVVACGGVAASASAQERQRLQPSPPAREAVALRYAPAALVDGQLVLMGEWREHTPGTRSVVSCQLIWDCMQPDSTTGEPIGGPECGLAEGQRWQFSTSYLNPFSANDMADAANTWATRAGWMWWWANTAQCYVGILTSDEWVSPACDEAVSTADGWIFDFGILPAGGYWANFDFGEASKDGWSMPGATPGSNMHFLSDRFDGSWVYLPEFPCHFLLWGTSDAGGLPGRPGRQEAQQHDDDSPTDAQHQMPDECHFYDLGLCPDPLGSTIAFWGPRGSASCYADCNGDTLVDTRDFFCFLNHYAAGKPEADCNGDTVIDSRDFLCFLSLFMDPPCPPPC
ncbi:MAG: hypothetical protein KJZ54_03310 [Phycisphaerales bacterium]|nr:hypothetical protein [Phycisphaerales bacterium]